MLEPVSFVRFPSVALYLHVVRLLAEQHQDLIPLFTSAIASKHPNAIISATVLNRCCLDGGKGCLGKFVRRKVIGESGVHCAHLNVLR